MEHWSGEQQKSAAEWTRCLLHCLEWYSGLCETWLGWIRMISWMPHFLVNPYLMVCFTTSWLRAEGGEGVGVGQAWAQLHPLNWCRDFFSIHPALHRKSRFPSFFEGSWVFSVIETWIRLLGLKNLGLWFSQRVTEDVLSGVLARPLPEQWEREAGPLFGAGRCIAQGGNWTVCRGWQVARGCSNSRAIPAGNRGHIQGEEARQPRDNDVTPAWWSLQAPPHCRPAHVPSFWFSPHHPSLPKPWEAQEYLGAYMGEGW